MNMAVEKQYLMESKLRVAMVVWSLPGGGLETFLFRLGEYLCRCGMEIDVITTEVPGAWSELFAEHGFNVINLAGWASSMPLFDAHRIARQLIKGKYDVVLLNNAKSAQKSLRLLPNNLMVIPIVHGTDSFSIQIPAINAKAWNVAVAVSPQVGHLFEPIVHDRPVRCILHGVELPDEVAWLQRGGLDSPLKLVFLGRIVDKEKGVFNLPDILLGLLEQGIKATLTIVGDGPDRELLQRLFREKGVADHVHFVGLVAPAEVYPLLLSAHVLLFPSYHEGFGLVLAEAQACGCVPVASRLPGITDIIVADGETGYLVDVGDIKDTVAAIVRLAQTPGLWQQMSRAGHSRVATQFSVASMGQAYAQLIKDAVAGEYPLPESRSKRTIWESLSISDFVPNIVRLLARSRYS